jgi:hypothetical protein
LKFFLFNFCPSFAESRGIALCPASILVLKDLILLARFFSADCCFCSGHTRFGFAGLALCPASILVLKDLIFSWQDFLVQIAVSLHLGLRHHLTLCCLSLRAGLGACLSVGHLPPVLLAFLVRA